jgi:glycosyltransferase involved in cell wall biosynthesis
MRKIPIPIKSHIIYNTANSKYFFPKTDLPKKNKIIIITHHWSDNINKGYSIYQQLHEYTKLNSNIEFRFIGRKFNDEFKSDIEILGPYKDMELGNCLREADIYLTASIYDACPMHVLEGISCGLPILYIDHVGGAKDICELSDKKIGESFKDFDELIGKISMIAENFQLYRKNIIENLEQYNSDICYKEFVRTFLSLSCEK